MLHGRAAGPFGPGHRGTTRQGNREKTGNSEPQQEGKQPEPKFVNEVRPPLFFGLQFGQV
ncbi:hypothetical protein GCM10028786_32480 [Flaviaesturariibacter terrae]